MSAQTQPVALPQAIVQLQAQARRMTTPCGAGQIVWHCWGKRAANAAPLVLLHGGSGSWTHWLRNIAFLVASGREVWAPDLPGFGDSHIVPGGVDADSMLAPLHGGLQTLLGQQICDLVGFSFGGMTAGMLAAAYPGIARQLVIVGAPAMGVGAKEPLRLLGWRHLACAKAQEDAHRYNLQALMLHDGALIDADTLALHALNVQRDRLPRRRLSQTDVLAQALAHIACPIHAIYGQHDKLYLGRNAELEHALRSAANFGELHWIADSGHWVQYEQPERFHTALLACLQAGAQ